MPKIVQNTTCVAPSSSVVRRCQTFFYCLCLWDNRRWSRSWSEWKLMKIGSSQFVRESKGRKWDTWNSITSKLFEKKTSEKMDFVTPTIGGKFYGWESALQAKHMRSFRKLFKKRFFVPTTYILQHFLSYRYTINFCQTNFHSQLPYIYICAKSCIVSESNLLRKFLVGVNSERELAQSA